ncbi:MAG: putative bifunctional diguanylate cyclase/phosphodiesterase [Bacillota bacterium]
MSIKKKLPLFFMLLVLAILIANNTLHYIRSKNELLKYNEREIALVTQEIAYQVENAKEGSLYVEDMIGRELRTASIAIKKSLPPNYENVKNEELKRLADELMISHITLLIQTDDDIIGIKSSDPHEINMSTKDWGYWYDAFQQLFSLNSVNVEKGLTLPHYWTGPIEVSSSNPEHTDKWGYYYDGSTNYIIDPYLRDNEVLEYEALFGPGKVMERFTNELEGVLELTVFNPKNFGQDNEVVHLNGNSFVRISEKPIWYGTYQYTNEQIDSEYVQKAIESGQVQKYRAELNDKDVKKTFVPINLDKEKPYVIGLTYDYGLIQKELNQQLIEHLLLLGIFMIIVFGTSFIFSRSITRPIGYIVEQVTEIAQGKFGKTLQLNRKDELGHLATNVNSLSTYLRTYLDDLKQSQSVVEFQAYHDPLTGLPNRRYFQEKLNEITICTNKAGKDVAVLFIDIDRFKYINDSLGHSKGDELIILISKRIKTCLSAERSVMTRQGGDEFIIMLRDYNNEEVIQIAEKIIETFQKPYYIQENEIYVGASCGISLYPRHTKDLETLIIYADMAMYSAKKQGGNKVVLYNDEISKSNNERSLIESKLRKAIEDDKIDIYYQPKINVRTGKITGVEALLRWFDDDLNFVSPGKFIPIAEDSGLIQPLWQSTMKKACQQIRKWNDGSTNPITLAINFSAKQFQDPEYMVQQVKDILTNSRLNPRYFEMEITESVLLDHSQETIKALESLKDFGIYISIDDFGVGYSSLTYLKTLPINCLKIDKSFIQEITEDLRNKEIAEAVINLARSLKLEVIAEGVEQEYQKDYLLKNDCFMMQGYLFSKPLCKDEFEQFLIQNELNEDKNA